MDLPGRKMDALMAVQVTNLQGVEWNENKATYYNSSFGTTANIPYYSTDIGDAFKIIDKVTGVDSNGRFRGSFVMSRFELYTAKFIFQTGEKTVETFEGSHSLPSMAICLAAKKLFVKGH